MFENLYSLEFSEDRAEDIEYMVSAEGEMVDLGKNLKARGHVEEWLDNLEKTMVKSLKREMKKGYTKYFSKPRKEWVLKHPT